MLLSKFSLQFTSWLFRNTKQRCIFATMQLQPIVQLRPQALQHVSHTPTGYHSNITKDIVMAEVHIIGELTGGSGFASSNLFCKWGMSVGTSWKVLEGITEGQTQVDHPKDGMVAKWSHPIDVHLSCKGLQGWPKMYFQVFHEDIFGRHELYGYGFCHVPTTHGMHSLECVTWKPVGSFKDQFTAFFMGGGPEVTQESLIYSSRDRQRLRTEAAGVVHVNIGLITRNFERFGVEMA